MFRTLYARLALALTVLLIAIGALYALLSNMATDYALQELTQKLNRNLAANIVADRHLVSGGKIDETAIKTTFQLYMDINPSIEIYLLDLQGGLVAYSADPKKIKRNRVALEPIRAFLAMERPYPLLGDDPRSHDRQKAFSVTPVPSPNNPQGYLYVVLRGEEFDSAERTVRESFFLRFSSWALIIALVVGLLAGLILFRLLTGRLQHLSALMQDFEESDFAGERRYRMRAGGGDEIDRLGASFNEMADQICQQIDRLKDQDALRRRLVAQISHDLRTPLAAMQGYMESLQIRSSKLSSAERRKFVDSALAQGRHLSRLVNELFELASLDAKEAVPDLVPFAPAELVHDVVHKHRLEAERKNIGIRVAAANDLPFALGDIGMTERVLDNLLDNALVHTPEKGAIEIRLTAGAQGVETEISNSGKPIPPDDLPHLFEPFYQGETRAADRRHAGLGLAIARRIMELQNGTIAARPGRNTGASFCFSLPLAQ